MRTCLLALIAVVSVPSVAGADTPRALPELARPALAPSRSLSSSEVAAQMRFYDADINTCYAAVAATARGTGELQITLSIHRTGQLDGIDIATAGLPARAAKQLASCVRGVVEGTAFPARKAPTTAVVPYRWQKTVAPGGGPQLSCWDPRGCPGR